MLEKWLISPVLIRVQAFHVSDPKLIVLLSIFKDWTICDLVYLRDFKYLIENPLGLFIYLLLL